MGTVQFVDGSIMEGRLNQGKFEGKVRQFGRDGKLQLVFIEKDFPMDLSG